MALIDAKEQVLEEAWGQPPSKSDVAGQMVGQAVETASADLSFPANQQIPAPTKEAVGQQAIVPSKPQLQHAVRLKAATGIQT